jgi:hypothetical protein
VLPVSLPPCVLLDGVVVGGGVVVVDGPRSVLPIENKMIII